MRALERETAVPLTVGAPQVAVSAGPESRRRKTLASVSRENAVGATTATSATLSATPRQRRSKSPEASGRTAAGMYSITSGGVHAIGLPLGRAEGRVSRAPASAAVGASCLLFVVIAAHGCLYGGDPLTAALALSQAAASVAADCIANKEPAVMGPCAIQRACACDKGIATALVLWLVVLSTTTVSGWMALAVAPLAPVLAWSRASASRAVWVWRHSLWHCFAVALAVGVLEAVYRSQRWRERMQLLSRMHLQNARVTGHAHVLVATAAWQLPLALGPLVVGALVTCLGMRPKASSLTTKQG
uniref:Uncharacterized protein n=1 Tax=Haptolina brevifila TaxID=156173 RepID=A0A7S2I658_9EUKA|mmetsp:Transcript_62205/g.122930  ORF Transcript_62205/g.122930 Transcript_62205/m.122930 type:complete len:302 (+) Transcript_62205:92-997(+)